MNLCLKGRMTMPMPLTTRLAMNPVDRMRGAILRVASHAVLLLLLAGCAGQQKFKEANDHFAAGNVDAGLASLDDAVKLEPANMEYRIAQANRRAGIVNRAVLAGDAAAREGRLSDAEKAYALARVYDPNNLMARQGVEALTVERRNRQAVSEAEALFAKGGAEQIAEAQEKLRKVLAENPNQKDALNLKTRINDAQAKLARPDARLAAAFRKPITLEFRDAPLRSVFDLVAKVSGLNFFFDKDIRPDLRATILAKDTSIEDAVRLLLVTNQLEQKVLNGNSVLIYPNTPQKQKDYQTLAVRTFYLANADVKAVSNTIKTILKTKDLVIDERLGLIIMRDTPEAIRMAERLVSLQDLSDPEVMLEVEILEIKRSRLMDLGVQWPASLSLVPLQVTGSTLTLEALRTLNRSTVQATVGSMTFNANQQDQDVNTLANPRIRVRNKEKAKIRIGDRVPIITTTSTATGFVAETVNYVEVGLSLEVEPNIFLDEEVAIKINLEVSTLGAQSVSKAGSLIYQIGTRGATTVLRLKDGESQILAGLISDEDRSSANKVPGLGEMPMVGRLFGTHRDDKQRSEILLSITPRLKRSIRRPDLMAAEFDSGTESSIGAPSLRLETVEASAGDPQPSARQAGQATPAVVAADAVGSRPSAGAAPPAPTGGAPGAQQAASAPVLPRAASAASSGFSLTWQAPQQIRSGEQFSAVLQLSSQGPVRGVPLLVGFDPQVLQVVGVVEGDYLKQGNGRTSFSHRIDSAQGKIFVAAIRQNASGTDAGVNGNGGVATITFKAIRPGVAKIQLLSASPEPALALPLALPMETTIRIVP